MTLIENWNAELRSWFFPVLCKLSAKAEHQDMDNPLSKRALTIRLPVAIPDDLEVEAGKRGKFGCVVVRQRGSHILVQCGKCQTVILTRYGVGLVRRRHALHAPYPGTRRTRAATNCTYALP